MVILQWVVVCLTLVSTRALSLFELDPQRRRLLVQTASFVPSLSHPIVAHAARGAAELDAEYYLKSIVGGNKPEGSVAAGQGPPVPPPRTLRDPLLRLLLNEHYNVNCLTILALVETARLAGPKGPGPDPRQLESEVERSIRSYQGKVSNAFYQRAAWQTPSITDQYFFDMSCYCVWRTAADYLSDYRDRDLFVRKLGTFVYSNLVQYNILKKKPSSTVSSCVPCVRELLDVFVRDGLIKGYRLGEQPKNNDDPVIFLDELDDETIEKGGSVNALVSIFEPASLGAALQLVGEQTRFVPDFVGAALCGLLTANHLQAFWETYFVDNVYRSNPKDFFPNEQLLQFTLSKK